MSDLMNKRERSLLQIQPRYDARDVWMALAEEEDVSFEVLELSSPPALNESRRFESCREWYKRSGRVTSVHGAFIDVNPGSGDDDFRALSQRRCVESCELARFLGAENVIFHCSCAPFLRGDYQEEWAKRCASFYQEIAARFSVHLFIENSMDVNCQPLKDLMERCGSERIGICLDLGHASYSRMPLTHWFEQLGEWIGYLHLSDNLGLYDDHLPLGEGIVDWELGDGLWRKAGGRMPMTLEVGGPEGVRSSLQFLRKHHYFGQ